MTPYELSKSGTEHGHQRAFFAMLNKIEKEGYAIAFQWADYAAPQGCLLHDELEPFIRQLTYAVPNGASYGVVDDYSYGVVDG